MTDKTEGLEVVEKHTHNYANASIDWHDNEDGKGDRHTKMLACHVTLMEAIQAAVQSAYQRGVLDERKKWEWLHEQQDDNDRLTKAMSDRNKEQTQRITQLEAVVVVARGALVLLIEPMGSWQAEPGIKAIAAIDSVGVSKT